MSIRYGIIVIKSVNFPNIQAVFNKFCQPHSVPESGDNPYLAGGDKPTLSIALVDHLIEAEANGQELYETWAAHCPNREAAMLMRTSGTEEMSHSLRLREVRQRMAG